MPSKILTQTTNLFSLYRYICGKSEVPETYNFWGLVSLIAAAVEDRVWYQKFKHEQLYPNLFIMLVGPSGLGKGVALSQLVRLAENSTNINKWRGRVTAAHLIDHLGKTTTDEWGQQCLANPKLWLIMDELQNDISPNPKMVEDFIFFMTEIYTASNYRIDTGTRTSGYVSIEKPIVNWLAGTTEADLRELMNTRLLRSGFTARCCFIFGEYDFNKRYEDIIYPDDYEEVFQHLCARIWMLQQLEGPLGITSTAKMELGLWYRTRPSPDDELLYAAWKRNHDLILKFSTILCLSDGGELIIQHKHIIKAQAMLNVVNEHYSRMVEAAVETRTTKPTNQMGKFLAEKGKIDHTSVLRYFRAKRGMNARQVKEAVNELMQDGCIKLEYGPKGGRIYHWKG